MVGSLRSLVRNVAAIDIIVITELWSASWNYGALGRWRVTGTTFGRTLEGARTQFMTTPRKIPLLDLRCLCDTRVRRKYTRSRRPYRAEGAKLSKLESVSGNRFCSASQNSVLPDSQQNSGQFCQCSADEWILTRSKITRDPRLTQPRRHANVPPTPTTPRSTRPPQNFPFIEGGERARWR